MICRVCNGKTIDPHGNVCPRCGGDGEEPDHAEQPIRRSEPQAGR